MPGILAFFSWAVVVEVSNFSFMSMAAPTRGDISQIYERNQEATVYVGNLDSRTDEELLWEIFTQGGPVKNVHIPRDKITGMHSSNVIPMLRVL